MSLITNNLDNALKYAYHYAQIRGVPMEIYSRPLHYSIDIDDESDVEPLQYIATPDINNEVPDSWRLEVVIGLSF